MAKQPSFQFYPGDWMKDPDLRRCSLFARGLLTDLLCICFESAVRGKLCERDGVTPWSDEDILRSVGENNETGADALAELLRKHVLSRDANGCVTSRRMIRDEEIRKMRADAGRVGGEQSGEAKREAKPKQNDSKTPPPSSSSSSSSSVIKPLTPLEKGNSKETGRRRRQTGTRQRDPLNPITLAEMRDWSKLVAWIASHGSRFDREQFGDFWKIQALALKHDEPEAFLEAVAAGKASRWVGIAGIGQGEFKRLVAEMGALT